MPPETRRFPNECTADNFSLATALAIVVGYLVCFFSALTRWGPLLSAQFLRMNASLNQAPGSQFRNAAQWFWKRLQFSENGGMMLIAVLVGVASGLAVVGFHGLVQHTTDLVRHASEVLASRGWWNGWVVMLLAPCGGALAAGYIVWLFARHDHNHGTSAVMEAVALRGGRMATVPISAKVVAAGVLIGAGGSAGPEDPCVQIGAVIGSAVGGRLKLSDTRIKMLVCSGVASAIAAAFNAPIAGVFFALEIVASEFSMQLFAPVMLAAVAGSIVSRAFLGTDPSFRVPVYELVNPLLETPLYALLGMFAAIVGSLMIYGLFRSEALFGKLHLSGPAKAAIGGLVVGVIAIEVPDALGISYGAAGHLLATKEALVWTALLLLVGKYFATMITVGSAGVGGMFAPALVLGSAMGRLFGEGVNYIFPAHMIGSPGAYALVGMGAVLAAEVRAPLTAVLLLFEITGDYRIILPIMASVVVASLFAHRLHSESVYTERLVRKGIQLRFGRDVNILEVVKVEEVMTKKPETIGPDFTIGMLTRLFNETHHHGMPIVGAEGRLVGIVTLTDLNRAGANGYSDSTPVDQIATRNLIVAFPEQSLNDAMRLMGQADVGRLPVVDPQHTDRLVGVLRRSDIIKAYRRMAMRRHELEFRLQQMKAGSESGGHLVNFTVPQGGALDGRMIRDLKLPFQAVISGIKRGSETIIPRGPTILKADDQLTVITRPGHVDAIVKVLQEGDAAVSALHYTELKLTVDCAACNRIVADLKLPRGLLIVSLRRQGQVHTVNGQTQLRVGDELTLMAPPALLQQARDQLMAPRATTAPENTSC